MRRRGDGDRFLARIGDIRRRDRTAALRSNFIVGYPGETEADHERLLRFVEAAQLDWCGLFAYSREEGTYAADLDGAVPPACWPSGWPSCGSCRTGSPSGNVTFRWVKGVEALVDQPGTGPFAAEAPEIDGGVIRASEHSRWGPSSRSWSPRLARHRPGGGGDRGDRQSSTSRPTTDPARRPRSPRPTAGDHPDAAVAGPVGDDPRRALVLGRGVDWIALAVTDGVDGAVGRRCRDPPARGVPSTPLADKILVLGAMFALVAADRFAVFPVALITAREVVISVFRAQLGRQGPGPPARSPRSRPSPRRPGGPAPSCPSPSTTPSWPAPPSGWPWASPCSAAPST